MDRQHDFSPVRLSRVVSLLTRPVRPGVAPNARPTAVRAAVSHGGRAGGGLLYLVRSDVGAGAVTTFLSCFSGIEAASVAWHTLGWKCVGVAEREPFPCAVLAYHYPNVPNLGDVMAEDFLDRVAAIKPDVLVGGPPCQDFSIAGLRAGIHGDRGNLTLRWVQIIHAARPDFCVTENVPGWLSANDGHAFGAFLAGLVGADTALVPPKKCGGRWTNAGMVAGPRGRAAWRILDAQYFGLAQRRKRVFVVFCPRNGADPAAILFNSASLRGDTPPSREARERVAPTISARTQGGGGLGTDFDLDGGLIAGTLNTVPAKGGWRIGPDEAAANHIVAASQQLYSIMPQNSGRDYKARPVDVAQPLMAAGPVGGNQGGDVIVTRALRGECFGIDGELNASVEHIGALQARPHAGNFGMVADALRGEGFDASEDGTGRGTPLVPVAYAIQERAVSENLENGPQGKGYQADIAYTLEARNKVQSVAAQAVRRLTPRECCRLMGLPDDYLDIQYRGKPAADGNRYKSLGNSMAVPVVRWIGQRIASQDIAA